MFSNVQYSVSVNDCVHVVPSRENSVSPSVDEAETTVFATWQEKFAASRLPEKTTELLFASQ